MKEAMATPLSVAEPWQGQERRALRPSLLALIPARLTREFEPSRGSISVSAFTTVGTVLSMALRSRHRKSRCGVALQRAMSPAPPMMARAVPVSGLSGSCDAFGGIPLCQMGSDFSVGISLKPAVSGTVHSAMSSFLLRSWLMTRMEAAPLYDWKTLALTIN